MQNDNNTHLKMMQLYNSAARSIFDMLFLYNELFFKVKLSAKNVVAQQTKRNFPVHIPMFPISTDRDFVRLLFTTFYQPDVWPGLD